MVKKTPIYCPKCGVFIGYMEDYMYMVIPVEGIRCPNCGEVVIHSNSPIYSIAK